MTKHFRTRYSVLFLMLFALTSVSSISAQRLDKKGNNNPYSPSPIAAMDENKVLAETVNIKSSEVVSAKVSRDMEILPSAPKPAGFTPAKNIDRTPGKPTDIYSVGVGDVIYVNLKNAPNASGYYTVRDSGTIDFPLAGENVSVKGKTTAEIAATIASAVTLYSNPQVEVKVREFGSHKINVTGMAEIKGERSIQRDAVPLFVVRADVNVDAKATKVLIRRNDLANVESFDLQDAKTDNVLIYPGNSIEFAADAQGKVLAVTGYFYIAGEVNKSGQKEYTAGTTLLQAISASGGAKGNPKKALVRRKGEKGALNVTDYDLRAITAGKVADPTLSPGDMIEIVN